MLSRKVAAQLHNHETPFYFYDIELLRKTLDCVTKLASERGFMLHYAIKANHDPRILAEIRSYGLGIDCVSGNEVKRAVESGFDPSKIVFAGVGKKDSEIEYAISQGILAINCESLEELEVINEIAGRLGRVQDIAIRINPDIDPKTNSCINTGKADTKFGVSYEELMDKAELVLSYPNVRIKGAHIHIGSQIRHMEVFVELCEKLNAIISRLTELGFDFRMIDVGGGLGINYDDPESEQIPDFAGAFDIIENHLEINGREVHFEFGRSIVAQCGELITTVLFRKDTATGRRLAIVDASMTELIRPMLYGAHHEIENITSTSDQTELYTVVGTACESTDVFDKDVRMPLTKRGDILTIKSAGAYGMSMASQYNLHPLPGAIYSDEL